MRTLVTMEDSTGKQVGKVVMTGRIGSFHVNCTVEGCGWTASASLDFGVDTVAREHVVEEHC